MSRNKMATDSNSMCIDHCAMVRCATNAKAHYYLLKSQVKNSKKRVSDLEEELDKAKDELEQLSNELKSQTTIVDVLVNLCNHDEVRVLKSEDGGVLCDTENEVIDVDALPSDALPSDDDDRSSPTDFKFDTSDATVKKSMLITPVKEGKNQKKPQAYEKQLNVHGSDLLSEGDSDYLGDSDSDVGDVPSKKRRQLKNANWHF